MIYIYIYIRRHVGSFHGVIVQKLQRKELDPKSTPPWSSATSSGVAGTDEEKSYMKSSNGAGKSPSTVSGANSCGSMNDQSSASSLPAVNPSEAGELAAGESTGVGGWVGPGAAAAWRAAAAWICWWVRRHAPPGIWGGGESGKLSRARRPRRQTAAASKARAAFSGDS